MERINGFACFLGRRNVDQLLAKALEAMRHRAWNGYLVDNGEPFRARSIQDIVQRDRGVKAAVGYCLTGWGTEEASPIHGRIYEAERRIIGGVKSGRVEPKRLAEALKGVDGDYSFVVLKRDHVVFARDPLGVKPLFIGRGEGLLGLASEAKALRTVGLEAESVQPGFVYTANLTGTDRFLVKTVSEPAYSEVDPEEAAESVLRLVQKSVERRVKGRRVAVGFSGGLDSSLLALLSSKVGGVKLVSVYAAGARDEVEAATSAKLLGLDLVEIRLTRDDVERMVKRVTQLIERVGSMDLAIGLAVNAAASAAQDEGCDGLVLGQLADELFGGYLKYLRAYGDRGVDAAHAMMVNDARLSYKTGFERDEEAASPYSDLLLPYASHDLVEYALSLHPKLKMNVESRDRKMVLRDAALKAGLPEEIAFKPKKALQYSSNLQRMVAKLRLS